MSKTVIFNAQMSCGGCANAIKRILSKVEGMEDIQPDLEKQIVTVTCAEEVDEQALLESLQKWGAAAGKTVSLAA